MYVWTHRTPGNPIRFKVVMLGDYGVGRESLVERLVVCISSLIHKAVNSTVFFKIILQKGTFTEDRSGSSGYDDMVRLECVQIYKPHTTN